MFLLGKGKEKKKHKNVTINYLYCEQAKEAWLVKKVSQY